MTLNRIEAASPESRSADLVAAKKILAFKVGDTWRFRTVDIDGWIAAQSTKAGDAD